MSDRFDRAMLERSTMDSAARSEFVASYTKLLTNAWSDEDFATRLKSDPKSVLGEVGLEVPDTATVAIRSEGGEGTLDDQVAIWEEGETTGTYVLYVPDVPKVETTELSEAELAGVAGGTDYCCCCSPCCTCT
jgi:hypothetical protein